MTNDLISRKALLEEVIKHNVAEAKYGDWMYTCKVINEINSAPAVSGEGEPVAFYDKDFDNPTIYFNTPHNRKFRESEDLVFLFTYPPDQTARISELQKQNDVMREALGDAIGYISAYKLVPVIEKWRKLIEECK